jgi:hypothetical protein
MRERDRLSKRELRMLLAVVDGALPPGEQAAAEARLNATAAGRRALVAHTRVAGALRGRGPATPDGLRRRVAAASAGPAAPAWARLRPALTIAAVAAVALALLLALPGVLRSEPTVVRAAGLVHRPASEPTPRTLPGTPAMLDRAVEGVAFPDWAAEHGWRAQGARSDDVGGRQTETVFYEHQGHRISYTIVAGPPLEIPKHARRFRVDGMALAAFRDPQRHDVLVFERDGHTCVLSGHVLHAETLVKLATSETDRPV